MSFRADLTIHGEDNRLLALVEVTNPERFDRAVAIGTRRNLRDIWSLPDVPYFLMVSQDVGFIWQGNDLSDGDPDFEFPMAPVLARYFPDLPNPGRLYGSTLELVVFQWLSDLTDPPRDEFLGEVPLADSEFAAAIRGGQVKMEVLV